MRHRRHPLETSEALVARAAGHSQSQVEAAAAAAVSVESSPEHPLVQTWPSAVDPAGEEGDQERDPPWWLGQKETAPRMATGSEPGLLPD